MNGKMQLGKMKHKLQLFDLRNTYQNVKLFNKTIKHFSFQNVLTQFKSKITLASNYGELNIERHSCRNKNDQIWNLSYNKTWQMFFVKVIANRDPAT